MTWRVLGGVALLSLLALVYVVRSTSPSAVVVVPSNTANVSSATPTRQPAVAPSAAATTCGPVQDQTTSAACLLLPGTLVEIVGYDGGLLASTPLVRVRLESAVMSAQFGNPVLFEADARTQIEPSARTIAATGVKAGARVQVAFDGRVPRAPSGAYLLTRFVVVLATAAPIHVCGKVTAYFVSDIPSGGLIEIDGHNYPIASSASLRPGQRTLPLPSVQVGSEVCLDGTTSDSGALLDFTVTPRTSQSSAAPVFGPEVAPLSWTP